MFNIVPSPDLAQWLIASGIEILRAALPNWHWRALAQGLIPTLPLPNIPDAFTLAHVRMTARWAAAQLASAKHKH